MKFSKAISIAAVAASLLVHVPVNASGNAHKYPVPVPSEAASTKPSDAVTTKPQDATSTKANDAVTAKPSEPASTKPKDAAASKSGDAVSAKPDVKISLPFTIVSRYEPLSGKDSLEAVPDLNRGRGGSK